MAIDSSIYGLLKPPVPLADPMEQYGKTLGIQSLIGQQGLQDLQTQQIRKGIADDAATEQAFRESGGDLAKARDLLYGRGLYKPAQAADKNLLDAKKTQGDITKTALESLGKSLSIHRDGLANVNDPQAAAQWVMAGFNDPLLSPIMQRSGSPQEAIARIPTDPQGFQQWKMQNGLGIEKFMEITAPKPNVASLGGRSALIETNPMAAGFNPKVDLTHTAPPANPASDMVLPNATGGYVPNKPLIEAKKGLAKAGASNISVSTADNKYAGKFAEGIASDDLAVRDAASKAPALADRSAAILNLLDSGKVITGTGADYRLALGKAMNLVGVTDSETVANTELLSTQLAKNTLDAIKASGLGAGSGFSNADRDFLEKAVGGQITLEKETLKRLATVAHNVARATVDKWADRVPQMPQEILKTTGISPKVDRIKPLAGSAVRINGDDGFNALPKGARYVGPDGVERTKP
jgi:hypothetical protein